MRIWPTSDPNFYTETRSSWCLHCREPNKKWKPAYSQAPHEMRSWYWTGSKTAVKGNEEKEEEEEEDLNEFLIKNWPKSRIRPAACLPLYYTTGNRFIRLQKDDPAGFKCAPLPISLIEARQVRDILCEEQQMKKKLSKLEKKANKKKGDKREEECN
ncbi:uncharacterized protein LOC119638635 [Glossina fuscipes]|uniref:Uncharacterized protein LOC119638635 n=1 Tax=Glossina fuscipes TaxID=7396 RepID=A0A9C5Z3R5_9MUSC|nr:uncharacterized protein LOC119638635 [Glossina fuscipes]